jgi:pyridoxine 5-phosphate synthase
MIRLSVNVNKIGTLRNSRGGSVPSVTQAVNVCLDAGAPGITVHPRQDERHIRAADVPEVAAIVAKRRASGADIEFNIEGDPRPGFIDMVVATRPQQCTLVPVMPGEITSQAGWSADTAPEVLRDVIVRLKNASVRVSLFVEPDRKAIDWVAGLRADRIELYTEPFARAHAKSERAGRESFAAYVEAAEHAHAAGLGINAGHDLDLENLRLFRTLPHLDEVSIGHALVSHALWVGLDRSVREYLAAVRV